MDDRNFGKYIAEEWIQTIEAPAASVREQDIYPLLNEWLDHVPRQTVLDIGCGQGVCCLQVCKDAFYIGVDPSPALIQRASSLFYDDHRSFILGNAYALPLNDHSVHAAFSVAVWHLLEDKEMASRELSRVLVESGKFLLILADPEFYEAWTNSYKEVHFEGKRFVGKRESQDGSISTDVLYLHELSEILKWLQNSGLAIQETKKFRNMIAILGEKD